MRWPFTPYGTAPLLLLCAGLSAAGWLLAAAVPGPWWPLVVPPLLFVLWFFRDPERHAEGGEDLLVSPADGVVTDVVTLHDPDLDAPATRIGVFQLRPTSRLSRRTTRNRVDRAGTCSSVQSEES
jgi:hypothetical protein